MTTQLVIGRLKELYLSHFGAPHSNKAYQEQGKSIKALVASVGEDNVIETFKFLLECEEPWLQNAKNIPGLIKWYDAIQTMRLNQDKGRVVASMSQLRRVQLQKEDARLAKHRRLLDE